MSSSTREIGKFGERIAQKYLEQLGYKIVTKNWYCNHGEIDLIFVENRKIVFVEVKFVTSRNYCTASELFTYSKRHNLLRTINVFRKKYRIEEGSWRLDLICVTKEVEKYWIQYFRDILNPL